MTPKKLKTRAVEKSSFRIYLEKAKDFYDTMLRAKDTGKWTAVGLNAVHCAISCCDAMLVFHLGIRSIGEDHIQAADLLARIPQEGISSEIIALKRIIAKKNLIAYECREFRQTEAIDILKLTERFYNWVFSSLPTIK
ncbi:MAG: hypothetical protein FJZ08_03865 [Candidatus Omnitrophica bacterium]|nr:hypothetical protein [Candidatus Omnitrophota bacterium]